MNRKTFVVTLLVLAGIIFGAYRYYITRTGALAGLKINSTPSASLFLNDQLVGKTPYESKHPAGEYVVKLIPDENSGQAVSWQGKVTLAPSLLTFIKRDLGTSDLASGGDTLTLESIEEDEAQLTVSSTPEAANILLDGQEKGITPLVLRDIPPGEHDITVSSPGFISRNIRVQTIVKYKLTAAFQLALSSEPGAQPSPTGEVPSATGETPAVEQVLIKDTPTGFLRVRSNPTTSATESSQVKPGEKFPLLEEKSGWYKIEYEAGKEGWVSGRYVEKVK